MIDALSLLQPAASASCKFLKEVHSGDTLYPELKIIPLTPQGDTGIVTTRATVHNQRGPRSSATPSERDRRVGTKHGSGRSRASRRPPPAIGAWTSSDRQRGRALSRSCCTS